MGYGEVDQLAINTIRLLAVSGGVSVYKAIELGEMREALHRRGI